MPLNHAEAVLSLQSDPLLGTMSQEEREAEAAALLGSDDPLDIALVVEEALAGAQAITAAAATVEATLEPCRLEGEQCGGREPVAGNGRCMTCGAQRALPGPPVATQEQIDEMFPRSDTEAPAAPPSAPPPPAATPTPLPAVAPDSRPVTARVKDALGLPDKDLASLIGVARPTAQAYVTGRLPELIDGVRAEYMLRAVRKRMAILAALENDLRTIVAVAD